MVTTKSRAGEATRPGTLASTVHERLRRDILQASLMPGEKLRVDRLRQRYGVGSSPVREALNRLTAEGLVAQIDQRGFKVAPVSLEDLLELTRTRCWIYEVGLREAIAHGDTEWEEGIVLAYHRLSRKSSRMQEDSSKMDPEWARLHRAFHTALIAACRSRWLIGFSETLFDCAERYRHLLAATTAAGRDIDREHRDIMDAILDRAADRAVELLNAHIIGTTDQLRTHGSALLQGDASHASGSVPTV